MVISIVKQKVVFMDNNVHTDMDGDNTHKGFTDTWIYVSTVYAGV